MPSATLPLVFCSPMRYVQGPGVTSRLAAEMLAVGLRGPALLVAGTTAIARLAPVWTQALGEAGWSHRVLAFGGESSRREIDAIAAEATALAAAVIIGAGGGKALDAAPVRSRGTWPAIRVLPDGVLDRCPDQCVVGDLR